MQAKEVDCLPYVIYGGEAHQLKLYEEWPDFRLVRAGIYTGKRVCVQPKTLNTGAQYLLFQKPFNDEKKVNCAYADKELMVEKKLSDQIVDVMKFFSGRTFQLGDKGLVEDEWSSLILSLLDIGIHSTFNRRRSGREGADRVVTHGDTSLINFNVFGNEKEVYSFDENELEGVPLVLIYAREKEESNQREPISNWLD